MRRGMFLKIPKMHLKKLDNFRLCLKQLSFKESAFVLVTNGLVFSKKGVGQA